MKYIAIKSIAEVRLDNEVMRMGNELQEFNDYHENICCKLRERGIQFRYGEERCKLIHRNMYDIYEKRNNKAHQYYEKYVEDVKLLRIKNDVRVVFNRVMKIDCINDVLKFL